MLEALGHYRILDRIGTGRIGELYRARDTRLGRTVAIRVVAAEIADDPARRAQFLDDAREAAALSHPNIATLYETGEDQGRLFLVFEFVPGETLKRIIAGGRLHPRRAVDLAAQVAGGLAEAHAHGIVHRRITSGDIIVTPKEKAKILDLGLAGWTSAADGREPSARPETAAYLAPEQARGERGDHRSDTFALGVVLFEMLTGRVPFTATAAASLPIPPSTVNRTVPLELDALVTRALARSADERYQSAAVVAAELRSIAALLGARAQQSESAGRPAATLARPRPRSHVRWIVLAILAAALAAMAWYGRNALERLWRSAAAVSDVRTPRSVATR
jgi:serine/threonine protein kinase